MFSLVPVLPAKAEIRFELLSLDATHWLRLCNSHSLSWKIINFELMEFVLLLLKTCSCQEIILSAQSMLQIPMLLQTARAALPLRLNQLSMVSFCLLDKLIKIETILH